MNSDEKILSAVNININSVGMLIAKQTSDKKIAIINEYTAVTETNTDKIYDIPLDNNELLRFSNKTFGDTVLAIKEMKEIAEENNVSGMLLTAASHLRHYENKSQLFSECRKIINIYPQLLNSKEEILLTFMGALSGFSDVRPVILLCIGSETLDIIFGTKVQVQHVFSFPLGYLSILRKFNIETRFSLRNQLGVQNFIRKKVKNVKKALREWRNKQEPLLLITGIPAIDYAAVIRKEPIYECEFADTVVSNKKEMSEMFKMFNKAPNTKRPILPYLDRNTEDFIMLPALLIIQTLLSTLDFNVFTITSHGLQFGLIKYMTDKEVRMTISNAMGKISTH